MSDDWHVTAPPTGSSPTSRHNPIYIQANGLYPNGQMLAMPSVGQPASNGPWYHGSPEHLVRYPDNRPPQSCPSRGPPLYSTGYISGLPMPNVHVDYPQMPGTIRDDTPRPFQGMPIEEGFHHHHNPYNYYPAPPPEPFTDYSFAFDPARIHQGRPPFHLPIHNTLVDNQYHLNAQLRFPDHIPEPASQHTRYAFEYAHNSLPQQYFFPPSPQMMLSPPMPQRAPGADMRNFNYKNGNTPPNNDLQRPPFLTRRSFGSNSSTNGSQPKRIVRHSSNSALDHTPTSGNTRLVRRVNNISNRPRGPLLEDFRNTRDKDWELKTIFGHIVEFSSDQFGSRFIQQALEEATDEDKEVVFEEIVPNKTNELVRDVFGNYVIQKFFEFGTSSQISILTTAIEDQIDNLSIHIYGCRVVQKALEFISAEQQSSIIRRLEHHILTCIKDAHGNHVVQKLIEVVAPERLTFLPVICESIHELATHPYGCRVLQRCLEHLPDNQTRLLLEAIHAHTNELMKDQYGNYVIQFILEHGQDLDRAAVLSSISGNVIRLAQHKYASNVCEKALLSTDTKTRSVLINEIMVADPGVDGETPILTMVKDQYANYVLQRALTLSEGDQRIAFFNQVQPLLVNLRQSTVAYSRPLVSMERLMDKYFNPQLIASPTNEPCSDPAEQ